MTSELVGDPDVMKPDAEPDMRYLHSRGEWDTRIGGPVAEAKTWRYATFSVSLILVLSVVTNIITQSQPRLQPWVVTVDETSGETTVVGKIAKANYIPREVEIKYFLSQWLQRVRAVPADPVLVKSNWLEAYKFMRRTAANKLNQLIQEDEESPLHRIGKETVTVEPISIVKVGDGNTYQARWRERIHDHRGNRVGNFTFHGIFGIEIDPPLKEDVLLTNPLGIFINTFSWNKEL